VKFLAHEREGVNAAISASGLDINDFVFVKRKGRMHIQHVGSDEDFTYFRRKTSSIRDGNHFELKQVYEINFQGHVIPFDDWLDVLEIFKKWLERIK